MKKDKAIWAYGEEVKNRGILDWLKAHTSFMKPIHRYEGDIEVKEDSIELKDDKDFYLGISREDVLNLNHGFDDVFRRGEDRSLGSTLKPLMIEFDESGEKRGIYLFVNYSRFPRISDNGEWFEYLSDWLNEK